VVVGAMQRIIVSLVCKGLNNGNICVVQDMSSDDSQRVIT
jgi:hypothetical protein